ncbi:hypothetical protein JXB02_04070 [Candidatus Woesearchaeota archaeon]|nr:hypothetical protein [Candidatus Woesearchaeota archaeon]
MRAATVVFLCILTLAAGCGGPSTLCLQNADCRMVHVCGCVALPEDCPQAYGLDRGFEDDLVCECTKHDCRLVDTDADFIGIEEPGSVCHKEELFQSHRRVASPEAAEAAFSAYMAAEHPAVGYQIEDIYRHAAPIDSFWAVSWTADEEVGGVTHATFSVDAEGRVFAIIICG